MLARLEGTDSVTKSKLDGKIALTLTELAPSQTELAYNASVGIQGRLAILGDMILRATATLMLEQFFARLRAELEGKGRQS
jgi:carbon monoxide dehydrogenase subunit G